MNLKQAVGVVLEGWTLPADVRKILEAAYWKESQAKEQLRCDSEAQPVAWIDVEDDGTMHGLRAWSDGSYRERALVLAASPQAAPVADTVTLTLTRAQAEVFSRCAEIAIAVSEGAPVAQAKAEPLTDAQIAAAKGRCPHFDYLSRAWHAGFDGEDMRFGTQGEIEAWHSGKQARAAIAATTKEAAK